MDAFFILLVYFTCKIQFRKARVRLVLVNVRAGNAKDADYIFRTIICLIRIHV